MAIQSNKPNLFPLLPLSSSPSSISPLFGSDHNPKGWDCSSTGSGEKISRKDWPRRVEVVVVVLILVVVVVVVIVAVQAIAAALVETVVVEIDHKSTEADFV